MAAGCTHFELPTTSYYDISVTMMSHSMVFLTGQRLSVDSGCRNVGRRQRRSQATQVRAALASPSEGGFHQTIDPHIFKLCTQAWDCVYSDVVCVAWHAQARPCWFRTCLLRNRIQRLPS